MSLISPDFQDDFLFMLMSMGILIISSGLAFGILTSFMLNNKKKGYFFMGWIALGILVSLIVFFRNFTILGIVALIIYLIFAVMTYIFIKKKRKENGK